jgi:hypothetical protein
LDLGGSKNSIHLLKKEAGNAARLYDSDQCE